MCGLHQFVLRKWTQSMNKHKIHQTSSQNFEGYSQTTATHIRIETKVLVATDYATDFATQIGLTLEALMMFSVCGLSPFPHFNKCTNIVFMSIVERLAYLVVPAKQEATFM